VIAHIVLFTPKAGLEPEDVRSFARLISDACRNIPTLVRSMVGRSVDVDAGYQRNFGDTTYKFAAILEFADQAGLVAYLNHPIHEELGRAFWEVCASTAILEVEFVDGMADNLIESIQEW